VVVFTFLANLAYFWLKHKRYLLEQKHQALLDAQSLAAASE
jgi:hypothetical protein